MGPELSGARKMAGVLCYCHLTGTENFKMHCVIISSPPVERYGEYEDVWFYVLKKYYLFIYLIFLSYFDVLMLKIFFIK
jgi:hypothetical protein